MGCRGVAVLPENMSRERFEWLEAWVTDPEDIVRTPGSESNVKEIYDACALLARDPTNVMLNQFCEFGNHLAIAWRPVERSRRVCGAHQRRLSAPRAFVSASGSAGTLAAGDTLKERYGSLTVAVEALECPTLLRNGFGEHNIQGIGDKHVPYIHNVMSTDVVTAVSDRSTDALDVLFNTPDGQPSSSRGGVAADVIAALPHLGLSSICNLVASIKVAKRLRASVRATSSSRVATDGSALYGSERAKTMARAVAGRLRRRAPPRPCSPSTSRAITTTTCSSARPTIATASSTSATSPGSSSRGVTLDDFEARRAKPSGTGFSTWCRDGTPAIDEFNDRTGVLSSW